MIQQRMELGNFPFQSNPHAKCVTKTGIKKKNRPMHLPASEDVCHIFSTRARIQPWHLPAKASICWMMLDDWGRLIWNLFVALHICRYYNSISERLRLRPWFQGSCLSRWRVHADYLKPLGSQRRILCFLSRPQMPKSADFNKDPGSHAMSGRYTQNLLIKLVWSRWHRNVTFPAQQLQTLAPD